VSLTAENQQHRWVKRGNLVDSRTSVTDVKFGPKHLGLILVSSAFLINSSYMNVWIHIGSLQSSNCTIQECWLVCCLLVGCLWLYVLQGVQDNTHTHTQPFNGLLSGTTRVRRYQKKHSPTHTHPDHRTSFIIFLHLQ